MRTPRTNQQWQEAVNAAAWCLAIDSAKQFGLIDTDMTFNIDRCLWILLRGSKRGIEPQEETAVDLKQGGLT